MYSQIPNYISVNGSRDPLTCVCPLGLLQSLLGLGAETSVGDAAQSLLLQRWVLVHQHVLEVRLQRPEERHVAGLKERKSTGEQ